MLQCSDEKQQMKQSICIFHNSDLILGLVQSSAADEKAAQTSLRCSEIRVIATQLPRS